MGVCLQTNSKCLPFAGIKFYDSRKFRSYEELFAVISPQMPGNVCRLEMQITTDYIFEVKNSSPLCHLVT